MNGNEKLASRFAGIIACLASVVAVPVAVGQESDSGEVVLEEVIVTAQKRGEQRIQYTPVAIEAVTGTDIEEANATGIDDLARMMSGVSIDDWGDGRKKVKIRGVSSSRVTEPSETVAIYLDDIPVTGSGNTQEENAASPDLSLIDLARVEVLKGPQSTLYGASSVGGVVRYILNRPDLDGFDSKVALGVNTISNGEEGWASDLMLNTPVTDEFALRFVGQYKDIAGYVDNLAPITGLLNEARVGPTDDMNSGTLREFNISGLWQITDRFSVLGRFISRNLDMDGGSQITRSASVLLGEPDPVFLDPEDPQAVKYTLDGVEDELEIGALTIEWVGESFTVTSSTSYLDRQVKDLNDESRVPLIVFGATPGQAPSSYRQNTSQEQFAEELRVSFDNGGPFKAVGGIYINNTDKYFFSGSNGPGIDQFIGIDSTEFGAPPDTLFWSSAEVEVDQTAIFGEATYAIDKWEITAGLRWFEIEQYQRILAGGFFNGGPTGGTGVTGKEDDLNPKLSLAYHVNDDIMVYGTASKGFRQGGVNSPIPAVLCASELIRVGFPDGAPPTFDSDSVWSYELGIKSELAQNRVRVNASVYHIEWSDVQGEVPLSDGSCAFQFFSNISAAKVDGAEISILAQATDNLMLSLNYGYVDSRTDGDNPNAGIPDGTPTPGVSDSTLSASATYDFQMFGKEASARLDYSYWSETDTFFERSNPRNRQIQGFGLFNGRVGIDVNEKLNVSIYGKNLTDERGITGGSGGIFGDLLYINRPREFGLRAVYQY